MTGLRGPWGREGKGREGLEIGDSEGRHLEELHPLAVVVGKVALQSIWQLARVHVVSEGLQ